MKPEELGSMPKKEKVDAAMSNVDAGHQRIHALIGNSIDLHFLDLVKVFSVFG